MYLLKHVEAALLYEKQTEQKQCITQQEPGVEGMPYLQQYENFYVLHQSEHVLVWLHQ